MRGGTAGLERAQAYERHILEELPCDSHVCTIFQEGVEGKRRVMLLIHGFRPMYRPLAGPNFNAFCFAEPDSVPVPTICRLAEVDPNLVELAYFHFRNSERWPRLQPKLDTKISRTQMQVVTNLFPFPEIEWCLEEANGIGGINHLITMRQTPPFLSEEEIRRLSEPSRTTVKAFYRHHRHQARH